MFFHTDYRPLLRDAAHHVVDEQVSTNFSVADPKFFSGSGLQYISNPDSDQYRYQA
jgi:hypothetical protein